DAQAAHDARFICGDEVADLLPAAVAGDDGSRDAARHILRRGPFDRFQPLLLREPGNVSRDEAAALLEDAVRLARFGIDPDMAAGGLRCLIRDTCNCKRSRVCYTQMSGHVRNPDRMRGASAIEICTGGMTSLTEQRVIVA